MVNELLDVAALTLTGIILYFMLRKEFNEDFTSL